MNKTLALTLIILFTGARLFAGEGMWLPLLLKQYNEKDMQAAGLKLSADDIYNINKSSLKDAVVSLGGFCTAEIVSNEGLLFTNHHCGYDAIAEHSTVEHDYLKNGFWAKSKADELSNPGLYVSILVYMRDVTSIVKEKTAGIKNEESRAMKVRAVRDSLEKAEPNENKYKIQVRSFFKGNEYYLLAYQVFTDIRLVGGPPATIGKFGGDQDNWMWPRHTGDFSIFRIYTGPDGKPAPYSKDNIPYKPKHFLPISLKGVKKNDYTMILGFPGSTDRYLTSADFETAANLENPYAIEAMETELSIMKADMDADRKIALVLASDYASTCNTYKYYVGQERQLKQMDYIDLEKQKEAAFTAWVNSDAERKKKYGDIFDNVRTADEKMKLIEPAYSYITYGFFAASFAKYGFTYYGLYGSLPDNDNKKNKTANIDSFAAATRKEVDKYFEKGAPGTDKKVLAAELYLIYSKLPQDKIPKFLEKEVKKYDAKDARNGINKYVDYIYKKSALLNKEKADALLEKPTSKKFEKDPFFALMMNMLNYYYAELSSTYNDMAKKNAENHRLYIEGLREWKNDKKFYPDANSTLRVTWGKVEPYYPQDAKFYNYYTTYKGILEKNNPNDPEFDAPARELELMRNKQFGRYAENDTLRINFLTTTDITGGNSGSPVMDGEGRLIGLAFDGDWESMIGDLYVDPRLNRTIAVDIRYVLWVIDVYAGADNIIKELKIE